MKLTLADFACKTSWKNTIVFNQKAVSTIFRTEYLYKQPRKLITRLHHAQANLDYMSAVDCHASDSFASCAEIIAIGNHILLLPKLCCIAVKTNKTWVLT